MKKIILTILLGGIIILGLTGCNKTNKKVEKEDSSSYKKLYLDIIKDENQTNPDLVYELIYLDNDDVPELIVNNKGFWLNSYTIKNDKVYKIIDGWPYGAMGNTGYEYIKKGNIIRNYNSDYAGLIKYVTYYKISDTKVVSYYDRELYTYYFNDKNNNQMPDNGEYTNKYQAYSYHFGDKTITKEEFDKYQIEGNYEFIEGTKTFNEIKAILES